MREGEQIERNRQDIAAHDARLIELETAIWEGPRFAAGAPSGQGDIFAGALLIAALILLSLLVIF